LSDDGAAQAYVSGGMPNYYFMWDNGEILSNAVNLTSGYHVVNLTDDWGCVVEDSVFIVEHSEIQTTIVVDNEVSCFGLSDGSVSATSIGGNPNYTYFWSNLSSSTIGVSTINSGLVYGDYYLTTQDIYGCVFVFEGVWVSGYCVHGCKEFNDAYTPIKYVNNKSLVTETYPENPNGSLNGVAAICSKNGRHLAMMPHPERTFLKWQLPWSPQYFEKSLVNTNYSPWFVLFQNAYEWCLHNTLRKN
jgi:hypothetical protein